MSKIVFYARKNVIAKGDVTNYFRVGTYIAENTDNEIYCCSHRLFDEMKLDKTNSKLRIIDLENDDISELSDAVFVVPINHIFLILDEISKLPSARLCVISMHPLSYLWFISQFPANKQDCTEFMKLIKERSRFGFMDICNNIAISGQSGIEFEKSYFPVCVDEGGIREYEPQPIVSDERTIRLGWFGRLDTDKLQSLVYFLDSLNETCPDMYFEFHLIGDGNAKSRINYSGYCSHFRFVFTSFIYDRDYLEYYIKNNVDVVLAMGISAIDIAAMGVPVILPIISSGKILNNRFVYLFDTKDYSLGFDPDSFNRIDMRSYTPREIIESVVFEKRKSEHGKKCYDFVMDNFTPAITGKCLLELLEQNTLTVESVLASPPVRKQIKRYKLYKKFRKNKTYDNYIQFVSRLNNILSQKGIKRITSGARELKRTLMSDLAKKKSS